MSSKVESRKKSLLLSILNGTVVAVAVTLILILLFALIIRFFNVKDSWIFPINQVIKVISLFVGTMAGLKNFKEKGFLKGLLIGVTYYLLSYIVFSILQSSISFSMSNIYDFLLTSLMGGIIGAIVVNIGK